MEWENVEQLLRVASQCEQSEQGLVSIRDLFEQTKQSYRGAK